VWPHTILDCFGETHSNAMAGACTTGFCITEYLRRHEFATADEHAWRRFEMHTVAEVLAALMKVGPRGRAVKAEDGKLVLGKRFTDCHSPLRRGQ
jgi:hypothetical protein